MLESPQNRLAAELRRLRTEKGVSGADLGASVGVSQTKISRFERQKLTPTAAEVRAIAASLGLDRVTADSLIELHASIEDRSVKELEVQMSDSQEHIAQVERLSFAVDEYSAHLIPAFFQTPDFVATLLSEYREIAGCGSEKDEFVSRGPVIRAQRAAELLDPRKRFRIVMADTAFSTMRGSPEVLLAQLKRIKQVSFRALEVRVFDTCNGSAPGSWFPFDIYDRKLVSIESHFTIAWIRNQATVNLYNKMFDQLWNHEHTTSDVDYYVDRAIDNLLASVDFDPSQIVDITSRAEGRTTA